MKTNSVTALLCFIILSGCQSSLIPKWFLQQNTEKEYFYGIGQGPTTTIATNNALSDIVYQISSSVSSKSNYTSYLSSSSNSSAMQKDINVSSNQVILQGYEIIKGTHINYDYFIKLRIKKDKIISIYIDKIISNQKEINNTIKNLNNIPEWPKYKEVKKLKSKIHENEEYIYIIKSIDQNHDINLISQNNYEQNKKLDIYQNKFTIEISSNDQRLKNIFTELLGKNDIQISSTSETKININSTYKTEEIGIQPKSYSSGNEFSLTLKSIDNNIQHKCSIQLSLSIVDKNTNDILDFKNFNISGISSVSKTNACHVALQKIKNEHEQKSIIDIFQ